eukprot:1026368-Pelagomonas_calceolata.AAC.1
MDRSSIKSTTMCVRWYQQVPWHRIRPLAWPSCPPASAGFETNGAATTGYCRLNGKLLCLLGGLGAGAGQGRHGHQAMLGSLSFKASQFKGLCLESKSVTQVHASVQDPNKGALDFMVGRAEISKAKVQQTNSNLYD